MKSLFVWFFSRMRVKASRRAYKAFADGTWEKVWPNDERGPNGLYLLYRTNGRCPNLEPIIKFHKSIILWCN